MSIRNRTVTVISGAAVATALAGAAAFAAVDASTSATMSDMPAHMAGLDPSAIAEMQSLMDEGASVGEMHRLMTEQGVDLGRMHGEMSRAGMNPGSMHRNVAPGR